MKRIIHNLDAIALLNNSIVGNHDCTVLDPPYELWEDLAWDLLRGAYNKGKKDSTLICFCNPTAPDKDGNRRHDIIIRTAVKAGYRFKYEIIWTHSQKSRYKHPLNCNHRILIFSKGNPKFNLPCMDHTEVSKKIKKRKPYRGAGGTRFGASTYIPNPNGRHLTDVIHCNLDRLDTIYINKKRVQSKPGKLIKILLLFSCKPKGNVLDPFAGCGTTGRIAHKLNLGYTLGDKNKVRSKYIQMRCNNNWI